MIRFGEIGATTVTAVSDSSVEVFDAPDLSNSNGMKLYRLVLSGDKAFHVQRNGDADPAASPRIPADTLIEVSVRGGDSLTAILADSGTNGTVWATVTD